MYTRSLVGACLLMAFSLPASAQNQTLAQRLGYPADAKLLVIHADDLAVAHSQDMASFEALNRGAVSSASIMVPCPWLTEVADYAKAHPDADLGLHLTLTSEWKNYKWGPIAPRDQVASLLDPQGYLYSDAGEAVRHIKPEEAEREVRAQVETALKMGIRPTHLDSHMGVLFTKPALVAVLVNVAHEYHLPFLMLKIPGTPPEMYAALKPTDVILDHVFMAAPPIKSNEWLSYYTHILQTLPPGVSELIVHLAYDDAEMQAVTVEHPDYGSAWRQRDFNVLTSPEFRKALGENHIVLLSWRNLGRLLPKL
ncbi:MAG: polysaccharide deacetylase family protein [Terriglobia bacterium]